MSDIVEWDVRVLERTIFQEAFSERPWIIHTQIEPKIKIHLIDPLKNHTGKDEYVCICGDTIPATAMQKFFLIKSVWEGKRAGK